MGTIVLKKFSIDLPEDIVNGMYNLAREKKESLDSIVAKLFRKEMKNAEQERIEVFRKACEEEWAEAKMAGITEQDVEDAIKEVRRQNHENRD